MNEGIEAKADCDVFLVDVPVINLDLKCFMDDTA